MLKVALTGGIATGKSHVRNRFEELGVPTIDADRLAREVVAPGTPGLQLVVARFGPRALGPDGRLDRGWLASVVFEDAGARRDLESIIHPRVYQAVQQWFADLHAPFGVADIPLLFETGRADRYDVVIVTYCPRALQVERIQQRDGVSREAAEHRLAAQWPIDEKVPLADYVIRTDGTFAETDAQVATVCEALRTRATGPPQA
jgi:dephospho-CoA kinase